MKYFQPHNNQTSSDLPQQFSLEWIMSEGKEISPTLCQLLCQISMKDQSKDKESMQESQPGEFSFYYFMPII
jgi:hypothetical protein